MIPKFKRTVFATIFFLFMISVGSYFVGLAFAEENSFAKILYSVNVGENRYFIHYNVCAGEKSLVSPSIVLESERDTVQFDTTLIIGENTCQGFESIIDTESPQFVKITIVE